MRRTHVKAALVATTIATVVALIPSASIVSAASGSTTPVVKEALHTRAHHNAAGFGSTSTISFHGGPVMTSPTGNHVYAIWYGAWAPTSQVIIADFASNLGGSPYFALNTSYTDAKGVKVANAVSLAGQTTDTAARGTALSDATILSIVSDAITSGRLPSDPNGVYAVLTAPGITETSGFLTQYCGWHAHATIGATDIKYAFVGDAAGPSLANCAQQSTVSPNGDPGADALVSVFAHEIEEAVTDPALNAWYDRRGNENADKCAWTFGTTYAANGALANMKLGARDFLIQRNWRAGSSQGCYLK